jgi:hypothetical protein
MSDRPDLRSITDTITCRSAGDSPVAHLVDVQFWLMGRDVEHPGGNLLPRLGFSREPAPRSGLPTRYRRETPTLRVIVWPCGILFSAEELDSLLVRGQPLAVVAGIHCGSLHNSTELVAASVQGRPCPPTALGAACQWFAEYEESVRAIAGVAHRVPRPGSRPSLAPPEPCSLDRAWRELDAEISGKVTQQ